MKGAALAVLIRSEDGSFTAALAKSLREVGKDVRLRSPLFAPRLEEGSEKEGTHAVRRGVLDTFGFQIDSLYRSWRAGEEVLEDPTWTVKRVIRSDNEYVKSVKQEGLWYPFRGSKICFVAVTTTQSQWEESALSRSGEFATFSREQVLAWGDGDMPEPERKAYGLAFELAPKRESEIEAQLKIMKEKAA